VVEKMVDGAAKVELRSQTGKKGLFHQRDNGFARVRSLGTPHRDLFGVSGATYLPIKGAKTVKIVRPPQNVVWHNCGLRAKTRGESHAMSSLLKAI
jgi:hypothetical protein